MKNINLIKTSIFEKKICNKKSIFNKKIYINKD